MSHELQKEGRYIVSLTRLKSGAYDPISLGGTIVTIKRGKPQAVSIKDINY